MAVIFAASDNPNDLVIFARADHVICKGEPLRCYTKADGITRARRALYTEKPIGEAANDAAPGMPVTVLVLKRGER